ncbi:hypothetical protein EVA_14752 [gut metagenome]|uniref:Uncharacterized protein n=1 Tax=gut metagenome TaxID=749906 RepID=J9FQC5_9ZZZZ
MLLPMLINLIQGNCLDKRHCNEPSLGLISLLQVDRKCKYLPSV